MATRKQDGDAAQEPVAGSNVAPPASPAVQQNEPDVTVTGPAPLPEDVQQERQRIEAQDQETLQLQQNTQPTPSQVELDEQRLKQLRGDAGGLYNTRDAKAS